MTPGTFRPPSGFRWRWIAYGCGGCAVIAAVFVGIGAALVVHAISSAPLSTFPTLAGSRQVGISISTTNTGSDDHRIWSEPGSAADVEAFYARSLRGAWTVDSRDDAGGVWTFHRRSHPGERGRMTLLSTPGGNAPTRVEVDYTY